MRSGHFINGHTEDVYQWLVKFYEMSGLGCFDNPTRFDTVGTNDHFFGFALVQCADILQIRIESSLGNIMGMADIVAHHRFFATYFTYSGHGI